MSESKAGKFLKNMLESGLNMSILKSRAYIVKKRACNSRSTSLDSEILSVTKNSASGQLRLRESVCRLRDVWFIRVHPPYHPAYSDMLVFLAAWTRLVADNEE